MRWSGPANLAAALLLGSLAGLGIQAAVAQGTTTEAEELAQVPPPSPRLQAALAEVREDGVYVTDDARWAVDEEAERVIEQAAATTDRKVYTIVWTASDQSGDGPPYIVDDHLERAFADEPVAVLVWQLGDTGVLYDSGYRFPDAEVAYGSDLKGDPALALPRMVAGIEQSEWEEPWTPDQGDDYWGGTGGALAAGALFGTLATGALLGLLYGFAAALRKRLPGRWDWT